MKIGNSSGAEVTIGLAVGPSSIDPHYQNLGANNEIRRHMFESLTWQDERRDLWPLLATTWAHRWGLAYDTQDTQENITKRIVPCTPCHELPVPRSRQADWLGVWQPPVR